MTPKVVIPLLLTAFAVLLLAHLLPYGREAPTTPSTAENAAESDKLAKVEEYQPGTQTQPAATDVTQLGQDQMPIGQQEEYVEARIAELAQLAMDNDSYGLQIILSELSNRNAQIRQAARDAAVQFGSADAIPALADSALQTDDPQEKVDIQKAISFLKLPSMFMAETQ